MDNLGDVKDAVDNSTTNNENNTDENDDIYESNDWKYDDEINNYDDAKNYIDGFADNQTIVVDGTIEGLSEKQDWDNAFGIVSGIIQFVG